jgi:ribonuclease-3
MKPFAHLEEKINFHFEDKKLLENAFVHRSYLNENKSFKYPSNEKFEFLGDSVLSLITSVYLFNHYKNLSEGAYTDIKASIVKTESLFEAAKKLQLGDYLYLSHGEDENKGRENMSILADCFEALLGAIYLDKGFDAAYNFVETFLFGETLDDIVQNNKYLSSKNRLQEYWQEKYKVLPIYTLIDESGPEHNKRYHIGVFHNEKLLGEGRGGSKKSAEEQAAQDALQKLGI